MIVLAAILIAQTTGVLNPCPAKAGVQPSKSANTAPQVEAQDFPVLPPEERPVVVKIELVVSEAGKPCDLRVVDPSNPRLEAAALESIRKWVFQPGKKRGKPIAVRALVEVRFRRDGAGPPPNFDIALQKFSSSDPQEVDSGIEILEALSSNRHVQADAFLGYILYKGMRVKQDHRRALTLISRAFAGGNPFAKFAMGLILVEGKALPENREGGVQLIRSAAESKVPAAKKWLSENGIMTMPADLTVK